MLTADKQLNHTALAWQREITASFLSNSRHGERRERRAIVQRHTMILCCDFLGKWEVGAPGPRGGRLSSAVDVMRDLIANGVKQEEFLANAELEIREEEDEVVLLDTSEGVRQELEVFLTASICDPMAFVNRERSNLQSLSRVLVFTVQGFQGAYDKYNLMFAFQVQSVPGRLSCRVFTVGVSVPQR